MTENPITDGDEYDVIADDTADDIEGEHPEGDYPQDIYDDDPDEPIDQDEIAVPEDDEEI